MDRWDILNKKKTEDFHDLMDAQWGAHIPGDYQYLFSGQDKLYIVHKDVAKIDFRKLRIDSMGLYVGEYRKKQLRLSIEGSQLVGPKATKNVVTVDKDGAIKWLRGEDLIVEDYTPLGKETPTGFVIIRWNDDYLGTGKMKDGAILNHVPKARRLLTSDVSN